MADICKERVHPIQTVSHQSLSHDKAKALITDLFSKIFDERLNVMKEALMEDLSLHYESKIASLVDEVGSLRCENDLLKKSMKSLEKAYIEQSDDIPSSLLI